MFKVWNIMASLMKATQHTVARPITDQLGYYEITQKQKTNTSFIDN